jgi:hypothetical protein
MNEFAFDSLEIDTAVPGQVSPLRKILVQKPVFSLVPSPDFSRNVVRCGV